MVRKHGGMVSVEPNSEGKGARFHLVLPATQAAAIEHPLRTDSWPESVRRVLLVEDDRAVADALTLTLEMMGAEVSVVYRGGDAADAVASFEPDLVILDIGLPDIKGTEVFARLRPLHPNLPVLFATGHAGEVAIQVAQLGGPVGHILKPFDFASLVTAVRALL